MKVHKASLDREIFNRGPETFRPHRLIRHPLAQTLLATHKPRLTQRVVAEEQPLLLDAGEDETGRAESVRLLAYFNRHWGEEYKGLVISLHGWEGCSHAVYNLVMAHVLLKAGYAVARLNLRDHGPNLHFDAHALNKGVFLGTLLAESHRAVQRLAELSTAGPVYLVGPSMGGNFALRMAARAVTDPIPNLRRVVAVSPAIDPDSATRTIDTHPLFHGYYRKRWLRSLLAKERHFPELYQFSPVARINSVWDMTEWLVSRYTDYGGAAAYFARYRVNSEPLAVPTTIIASADDPVIPVESIRSLASSPLLSIRLSDYGGHVGFVDLPLRRYLPDLVLQSLQ